MDNAILHIAKGLQHCVMKLQNFKQANVSHLILKMCNRKNKRESDGIDCIHPIKCNCSHPVDIKRALHSTTNRFLQRCNSNRLAE